MAKIIIDGTEHEFSTDFDIGEGRIIKRYTDLNLRDLEGHDPSDPNLIAAMVHIIFRREEPGLSFSELEEKVDRVKFAQIDLADEAVDASPPDQSKPFEKPDSDGETGAPSNGLPAPSPETESPETTGLPV